MVEMIENILIAAYCIPILPVMFFSAVHNCVEDPTGDYIWVGIGIGMLWPVVLIISLATKLVKIFDNIIKKTSYNVAILENKDLKQYK